MAHTQKANLINDMTLESYHGTLRPKVQGTLNLHKVFSNIPLDFFIMLPLAQASSAETAKPTTPPRAPFKIPLRVIGQVVASPHALWT